MSKQLSVKLISDHRPGLFENAVNIFIKSHNVSKVSYSTVSAGDTEGCYPLFTAFILFYSENSG